MKKIKILNQLHENYLVAVVRGKSKDDAIAAVQQMMKVAFIILRLPLQRLKQKKLFDT